MEVIDVVDIKQEIFDELIFDAQDRSALEKAKQTLKTRGCCLIKNIFSPEEIKPLVEETKDLFYLIDNLRANGLLTADGEKYLFGGHPANILSRLEYLNLALNKSFFISLMQRYFNSEKIVASTESSGIRYCDIEIWKNFLPWHQDVFERKDEFVTCWVPFMDIKDGIPGLDLIPKKLTMRLGAQDGLDVAYNDRGIEKDEIVAVAGEYKIWRPRMKVGDVLLFDPYCVHRTAHSERFEKHRFSLDIRLHPINIVPEETWRTSFITLPSSGLNQFHKSAAERERVVFNLKHLLRQVVDPTVSSTISKRSLFRRLIARVFR